MNKSPSLKLLAIFLKQSHINLIESIKRRQAYVTHLLFSTGLGAISNITELILILTRVSENKSIMIKGT